MKIKYSNDADILLIEFKEGTPIDSIDLKEGIILHLDQKGAPLEMEILDASKFVSMDEFNILMRNGCQVSTFDSNTSFRF